MFLDGNRFLFFPVLSFWGSNQEARGRLDRLEILPRCPGNVGGGGSGDLHLPGSGGVRALKISIFLESPCPWIPRMVPFRSWLSLAAWDGHAPRPQVAGLRVREAGPKPNRGSKRGLYGLSLASHYTWKWNHWGKETHKTYVSPTRSDYTV